MGRHSFLIINSKTNQYAFVAIKLVTVVSVHHSGIGSSKTIEGELLRLLSHFIQFSVSKHP